MEHMKTYREVLNEGSHQDYLNRELWAATMYGSPEHVADLLDRGAEINSADRLGMAALHWAALNKNETMIKMLLHRGADPNLGDMKGRTPLRTLMGNATYRPPGLIDIAKFFIGYGADPFKAFNSPREILDCFKGDISWMPKGLREKIIRADKVKSVFGK